MAAYALDRFRAPSVKAAARSLGPRLVSAIRSEDLARIAVPTTLIWGRHDLGVRLEIAEAASARYDWPLHVIENAANDPPSTAGSVPASATRRTRKMRR
jgi:pimeloyl-ACP methyl ester carboxylesterase